MERQKTKQNRITNMTLKEKNKFGRLTLPDFKTYYKATLIKQCDISGKKIDKSREKNTKLKK